MAGKRLRVAVVGAGYFARFHLDAWTRMADVEVVAVCDQDRAKAEAMARDFAVTAVHTDLAQMLAAVQPDLLDIATPPPTHADFCRLALARQVPVVCQKPFCVNFAEATATVAAAEAAGVELIVHENFRFEPWYRRMKGAIDAGGLGQVYQATFRLRPGDGQGPGAYLARQPYFQTMPRFLVRETAIHFIDVFRFLFGEVRGVYADLRRLNPAIAGEDAGLIVLDFGDQRRALFDGNRLADHAAADRRMTMGEMAIDGADAALRLDGFGRLWLRPRGENAEAEIAFPWENRGYGGDCVYLCLRHVAAHFNSGGAIENSGRDYLANLAVEEAIYRSHAERRRVAIGDAG